MSVVDSAILYAVACWGSRMRVADASRFNKLIGKASDVVGMECDSETLVSERKMLIMLQTILDNVSHPLHDLLVRHRSTFSERLIPPKCMTEDLFLLLCLQGATVMKQFPPWHK